MSCCVAVRSAQFMLYEYVVQVTHRGLPGSDWTEASMVWYLRMLCTSRRLELQINS